MSEFLRHTNHPRKPNTKPRKPNDSGVPINIDNHVMIGIRKKYVEGLYKKIPHKLKTNNKITKTEGEKVTVKK